MSHRGMNNREVMRGDASLSLSASKSMTSAVFTLARLFACDLSQSRGVFVDVCQCANAQPALGFEALSGVQLIA